MHVCFQIQKLILARKKALPVRMSSKMNGVTVGFSFPSVGCKTDRGDNFI